MNNQDILRNKVKEVKWRNDISYKTLSKLLDMNYNSFVNFVHGYKRLGYSRCVRLNSIIDEVKSKGE